MTVATEGALKAKDSLVNSMSGIHRELSGIYQRFAVIVATGHSYAESMTHVISGIAGLWEVLAEAVDIASWLDEDYDTPGPGWMLLDRIEYGMRRCLMLTERSIEHASQLLRVLGVLVGESERCANTWRAWRPS